MWENDKARLGKNERGTNMEWIRKNWDILFAIGASALIIFGFYLWYVNRQEELDYTYELDEELYECTNGWYDQRYTKLDVEQVEDPYELVKRNAKTYYAKVRNCRWEQKGSEPEGYWCEFCYNWKEK